MDPPAWSGARSYSARQRTHRRSRPMRRRWTAPRQAASLTSRDHAGVVLAAHPLSYVESRGMSRVCRAWRAYGMRALASQAYIGGDALSSPGWMAQTTTGRIVCAGSISSPAGVCFRLWRVWHAHVLASHPKRQSTKQGGKLDKELLASMHYDCVIRNAAEVLPAKFTCGRWAGDHRAFAAQCAKMACERRRGQRPQAVA